LADKKRIPKFVLAPGHFTNLMFSLRKGAK